MTQPMQMYALTGGPAQPEFSAFTPIGTSDMVDLGTGDFNYNIPVMDVGGYPLNLAYSSGVTMDQEASWVGLGWDLGVGQINRQMRGLPDDFDGDKMIYENNMRPNTTIGGKVNVFIAPFGTMENLTAGVGVGIKYNNYDGFGFSVDGGLTYQISDNVSVGMNLESSSTDGVSVSPSVSFHHKFTDKNNKENSLTGSLGVSMNSRKGVETVTMSASRQITNVKKTDTQKGDSDSFSSGGGLSLNDASFTPTKRVGMSTSNVMFSLNIEGAVMGIDPGVKFSGYRTSQKVKDSEKYKIESGFGYENTYHATVNDIMDFNREKDRTVTKNTVSLPVTNYTYDLYSVQGQGVGGMFRPYRSQVGYVSDNNMSDDSFGVTLGGEIGAGVGTHFGFDGAVTDSKSSTGLWTRNNAAYGRTVEKKINKPNYEQVYFKNVGGLAVDKELEIFTQKLGGYDPVTFKVEGSKFHRGTESAYYNKLMTAAIPVGTEPAIKRDQYRLSRNQSIQKLTRAEAAKYGFRTKFSKYSKRGKNNHHTSEIRILKEGGEHYIYGRAAYNVVKKETTFDVGTTPVVDCKGGLVAYNPGTDNSSGNNQGGDQYFNRITTPAYAHTYLLTAVLSSDYQDLTGDGASDDDLGGYTKFTYTKNKKGLYKWRVPYKENQANYDEGLKSLKKDNKGNYQYGEKELLYIEKIETKTHVAIFTISPRKDAYGVKGENGGSDNGEDSKMWKLEKIALYSKPEYEAHKENLEAATPIKTAHFVYDYSLCKKVDNNLHEAAVSPAELANQGGKLTLKKVYFTYQNSNMGKYTPYNFNYDEANNYDYDLKGYDAWGNYMPTNPGVGCDSGSPLSNAEFPYVQQQSQADADKHASAWLLKSVDLPSGGKMDLEYESDDYKFVQDKEAMQMFKVIGAGDSESVISTNNSLYDKQFIYVKLERRPGTLPYTQASFYEKFIRKIGDKPVYFRFLMNMADPDVDNADKYDYVTGYLDFHAEEAGRHKLITVGDDQYAALRVMDGTGGYNPITRAGFYFGRQYLNNIIYSLTGNEDVNDVKGVVLSLAHLVPDILNIFKSPNKQLEDKEIAKYFKTNKSWIRLMQPDGKKFGGGSRIKELKIQDKWDVMTNHTDDAAYKQAYGQQYSYAEDDGTSTGVAAYEPLSSKENPLVTPFYDRAHRESILGPDTQNYVEMPFGESYYPSPKITYSKVSVRNLARTRDVEGTGGNGNQPDQVTLKKHATGKVVTEFYTTRDYPTVSDITMMNPKFDKSDLGAILNINVKTHLTMSQGFSIHTNDMDGKMKSQWVYAEGQTSPISGAEYKYEQKPAAVPGENPISGKLNNKVLTVDSKGAISEKLIGVDYDVINDFRENNSVTETAGIHFNTEGLPLLIVFVIVPIPLPSFSHHENILRTAVTTKTIHSTGILSETILYDLGSKVSTKNLAWDADSGDVLLTQTVNEYNDNYFTFKFPAYWAYDGMAQAAANLGLEWKISSSNGKYKFDGLYSASNYLSEGDELWIVSKVSPVDKKGFKAWVVNLEANNSFDLIDADGLKIKSSKLVQGEIKVIRSGHRNMATASMASVTSMKNPLFNYLPNNTIGTRKGNIGAAPFSSTTPAEYKIVNASAVLYKGDWAAQCECALPKMTYEMKDNVKVLSFEYDKNSADDIDIVASRSYNPYRYNILGNWRAVKAYTYLTGRNKTANPTPRSTGFFNNFVPLYTFSANRWQVNTANLTDKWTFTSEVSQYNPYGQEIENKDALSRYSTVVYGYNNRFATAVAGNTKYSELGFDGFEDYNFNTCISKSHFDFQQTLLEHKISVSNEQSHTGRKSLRIAPSTAQEINSANVVKKVAICVQGNNQSSGKLTVKKETVDKETIKKMINNTAAAKTNKTTK